MSGGSHKKRVFVVHYRIGKRDGVSLEIEKRAQILKKLKCHVFLLAEVVAKK